jgi:LysM repeat protein
MNKLQSNSVKPKQKLVVGYKYPTPAAKPTASDSSATVKPTPKPATQSPPANPANTNKVIVYTVKKGDTMGSIANKYGVNYKTLAAYNKITNVNALAIGQKLKIPPKQ